MGRTNLTHADRGERKNLTHADRGEGVQNSQKKTDVIKEQPHISDPKNCVPNKFRFKTTVGQIMFLGEKGEEKKLDSKNIWVQKDLGPKIWVQNSGSQKMLR